MPPVSSPLTTLKTWSPLLDGDLADRARAAVDDIAEALRSPATAEADPTITGTALAAGTPGAALFFAELHAATGEQADADTAFAFLDQAIEQAAEERPAVQLYTGTVGVGWTLAYLERHLLDPDPEPNDVDTLVDAVLNTGRWREFDVIRGLAGVGVYLLERRHPLDRVVDALDAISEKTDDGTTWWVDPTLVTEERAEMFPNGYYDTGMAHGQAGVIAMLAAAHASGTENAKPMLEDTTRWLLAQRLPEGKGPGRYPLIFGKGDDSPSGGRLAWCYGDVGLAVALLAAGTALEDEAVLAEARELAYASADRSVESAGAMDASLCHGSGGLALMFARLAHGFGGDERLADAARTWARVILDMRVPGEGIGGVRYSVPVGDQRGWEARAGLLEGATGVGMTLLALTTANPPDWDVLFLSRPVR